MQRKGFHGTGPRTRQQCEYKMATAAAVLLLPLDSMSPKHPIKACLLPVVRWECGGWGAAEERGQKKKKINGAIFSFCLLQSVIEMENQMNGKQIIVLSIFPACPTRVSAEWSWVGDMTRTKCEIEQLGGNKSALTTKSDQHVAAAGSSHFRICPGAVRTK